MPSCKGEEGLPGSLPARHSPPLEGLGEVTWVSDCTLESDLEMYFPDQYVPSDSERMLLYRELDNLAASQHLDDDLAAYRRRLIDRFGEIPEVGEELIRVVPLRVCGKQLGIEKIILKQSKMHLYFVNNPDSPYFQSEAFGLILDYVSSHPQNCRFHEVGGKRAIIIADVPTVTQAVSLLSQMLQNKSITS